jgi:hypothetical protein
VVIESVKCCFEADSATVGYRGSGQGLDRSAAPDPDPTVQRTRKQTVLEGDLPSLVPGQSLANVVAARTPVPSAISDQ